MAYVIVFVILCLVYPTCGQTEEEAKKYLDDLEDEYSQKCNEIGNAVWDYATDITNDYVAGKYKSKSREFLKFSKEISHKLSTYPYESFKSVDLYRKIRFHSDLGISVLNEQELSQLEDTAVEMSRIYSTATICSYDERDNDNCQPMNLEPELEYVMASSRDWDELQYTWEKWREVTGQQMLHLFVKKNYLLNQAAKKNGYENQGESWLNIYTVTRKEATYYSTEEVVLRPITYRIFKEIINRLWEQVSDSLYKKLHAYVRMKLRKVYGANRIGPKSPIPAHLLGNMWAQDWQHIMDIVSPFPDQSNFDVTESMQSNNWTVNKMFKEAESFFTSIGLYDMTDTFWKKSVLDGTKWEKKMTCHGSASDLCLGKDSQDFRIKMCTSINMEDLTVAHHEMGHIEYYMAYRDQPFMFREGANPGFHEAIGDLIALSVSTPNHMENVLGLKSMKSTQSQAADDDSAYDCDQKKEINSLMSMALQKISFLPFGYLMDKYRWDVFEETVSEQKLNAHWWKLRREIQGVAPPEGNRMESEFFDPGAKYHIANYVPYVRYFASYILQFQFHKNLCKDAGFKGPLHKCDIYNSVKAGDKLKEALKLGFSKPWPIVLEKLAGTVKMDASAIEEYFRPLIVFLDKELEKEGEAIGWESEENSGSKFKPNFMFTIVIALFFIFL